MKTLIYEIFVLCLMLSSTSAANAAPAPSVGEILKQTARTYATCKTYRDTGTVTLGSTYAGRKIRSVIRFNTAFERPDNFRFEFNQKDPTGEAVRMVVWTNGGKAYRWWTIEPKVVSDQLSMLIAGATGVSMGAAHTVPRLLMPDKISGRMLTDMKGGKLTGTETLNGVQCTRIRASSPGRETIIWIGKQDYLIYKILEDVRSLDFLTTTVYKPQINAPIPAKAFESGVGK